MAEVFLGFMLGVFLTRFINRMQSPKFDRVLAWDDGVFAWRPVPEGTKLEPHRKYLAAMPVYAGAEKEG